MKTHPLRYSKEDLEEFETLLSKKLEQTNQELTHLKNSILRTASGYDSNHKAAKPLEDGANALEKEQLNQLAARIQRYKIQLENAMIRIKNGTYGICIKTGKLIPKARLRAVPHTRYSIEAKQSK